MSTHLTEKTESKFPEAALARQTLLFDDARPASPNGGLRPAINPDGIATNGIT